VIVVFEVLLGVVSNDYKESLDIHYLLANWSGYQLAEVQG
jgi:hypothetical protein